MRERETETETENERGEGQRGRNKKPYVGLDPEITRTESKADI